MHYMNNRNIVFFVYDEVNALDLFGPLQVFETANLLSLDKEKDNIYNITIYSLLGGLLKTSSGVSINTKCIDDINTEIDTLIIPGGAKIEKASKDNAYTGLIKKLSLEANRVVSICNAAFILAECGFLDGRRVVTHWLLCDSLKEKYPLIKINPNAIYINDDKLWTSAGITAGIDLCLALIAQDHGRELCLSIAKFLVVFLYRPGGQSQFSEYLHLQSKSERFAELLEWIGNNLDKNMQIRNLASRVNMSERSFMRHFTSETGLTPAKAVDNIRVEKSRYYLIETDYSLKKIASLCGFYDVNLFRRKFYRKFQQYPIEYRNCFNKQT